MCDIYRNSILTISASCSASDCAGFLKERIIDDPIELDNPPRLQSVRFRPTIDHSRMLHDDPIHARAWTFQETILPRRLLSFGSYEASWECEARRQCECRQIQYGQQAETSSKELGRAAYREYTRAVVEGRFNLRKKFPFPGRDTGIPPHQLDLRRPEKRAADLLAHAPSTENQETNQIYLNEVYEELILSAPTWMLKPDAIVIDNSGSHLRHTQDGKFRFELIPEFHSTYVEWMQKTCLNILAVNSFYRYWRRVLIPEYTRRALSKDSDRLIALQAIASDIHAEINDRYLAGLWEGDLINQLCWRSADDRSLPADNESPSWSWSSIRGPVTPCLTEESENNRSGPRNMHITHANCSVAGQDPCGRILNGSISMGASAMAVRYVRNKGTGLLEFHAGASRKEKPGAEATVPLKLEFSPDTPLGCQADGSLTRCADRDYLNTRHHDHEMKAILLLVNGGGSGDFCVLVCSLVPGAEQSKTCRRLGIGTITQRNLESFFPYLYRDEFVLI